MVMPVEKLFGSEVDQMDRLTFLVDFDQARGRGNDVLDSRKSVIVDIVFFRIND